MGVKLKEKLKEIYQMVSGESDKNPTPYETSKEYKAYLLKVERQRSEILEKMRRQTLRGQ